MRSISYQLDKRFTSNSAFGIGTRRSPEIGVVKKRGCDNPKT